MEKHDVPNARDEIRKLQEALKAEGQDPGSTDGFIDKKAASCLEGFSKG
jgi:hypothetical protein